ncbi:hypothetical protein [Aneurinibacillus terranovensis]|nr:hypothetical protein [Aneurinibacillus terranovensis]
MASYAEKKGITLAIEPTWGYRVVVIAAHLFLVIVNREKGRNKAYIV